MARFEPKFAFTFAAGAAACVWGAVSSSWLAWPALALGVVAVAYAGLGPAPFWKRAHGGLHPLAMLVLAPYLVVAWIVLLALRLRSEPGHNEVRPGLFLGRRPLRARELPVGVSLIVDLTAEFPGVRPKGVEYICLPTLDGSAPHDLAVARALVERVLAHEGIVYVHCAAGHGRSAAIVAAVLVLEGNAADVGDAIRFIRKVRPGIGLSRSQRAFVRALTAT